MTQKSPKHASSSFGAFSTSLLKIGLLTTILAALLVYLQIRGNQDALNAFSISHRIHMSGVSRAEMQSISETISLGNALMEALNEELPDSENDDFNPNLESAVLRLAQDALAELEDDLLHNRSCVPTFCKEPYHFFDHRHHIKNYTFLNTFPGSGNTWLRSIIQEGTRVYTGSIYNDPRIARAGYIGERRPALTKNAITSAIKAHNNAPRLFETYGSIITAVIQIVRSPFDTVLAEFNRKNTGGNHVEVADEKAHANYFDAATTSWKNFHYTFNNLDRVYPLQKRNLKDINAVMRIEFKKYKQNRPVPILTMFYEDFVRDPRTSVAHLYAFLKTQYGNFVPPVKDSIVCAAYNAQKEEAFHRHATEKIKTPLYSWSRNETKPIGETLCEKLEPFWNEHKWGICDGKLQKEKVELNKKKPFLPGVELFPECSASTIQQ